MVTGHFLRGGDGHDAAVVNEFESLEVGSPDGSAPDLHPAGFLQRHGAADGLAVDGEFQKRPVGDVAVTGGELLEPVPRGELSADRDVDP